MDALLQHRNGACKHAPYAILPVISRVQFPDTLTQAWTITPATPIVNLR